MPVSAISFTTSLAPGRIHAIAAPAPAVTDVHRPQRTRMTQVPRRRQTLKPRTKPMVTATQLLRTRRNPRRILSLLRKPKLQSQQRTKQRSLRLATSVNMKPAPPSLLKQSNPPLQMNQASRRLRSRRPTRAMLQRLRTEPLPLRKKPMERRTRRRAVEARRLRLLLRNQQFPLKAPVAERAAGPRLPLRWLLSA